MGRERGRAGNEQGKNLHCDKQPIGLGVHSLVKLFREMHSIGQFTYDTTCFGFSTQNTGIFKKAKKHISIGFKNKSECQLLI